MRPAELIVLTYVETKQRCPSWRSSTKGGYEECEENGEHRSRADYRGIVFSRLLCCFPRLLVALIPIVEVGEVESAAVAVNEAALVAVTKRCPGFVVFGAARCERVKSLLRCG